MRPGVNGAILFDMKPETKLRIFKKFRDAEKRIEKLEAQVKLLTEKLAVKEVKREEQAAKPSEAKSVDGA